MVLPQTPQLAPAKSPLREQQQEELQDAYPNHTPSQWLREHFPHKRAQ